MNKRDLDWMMNDDHTVRFSIDPAEIAKIVTDALAGADEDVIHKRMKELGWRLLSPGEVVCREIPCPKCHGFGNYNISSRVTTYARKCDRCHGTGNVYKKVEA